jgi:hypothetical protein
VGSWRIDGVADTFVIMLPERLAIRYINDVRRNVATPPPAKVG